MERKHPRQPILLAADNVVRFKENKIVSWMLEMGRLGAKFDLNVIALQDFSQEDRIQLAQLIGYSVSGFGDLSYVPEAEVDACDAEAHRVLHPRWVIRFDDVKAYNRDDGFIVDLSEATRYETQQQAQDKSETLTGPLTVVNELEAE
jgi:hypothetical protein